MRSFFPINSLSDAHRKGNLTLIPFPCFNYTRHIRFGGFLNEISKLNNIQIPLGGFLAKVAYKIEK